MKDNKFKVNSKNITPEQERAILKNAPSEKERRTDDKKRAINLLLQESLLDAIDEAKIKTCQDRANFIRGAITEKLQSLNLWD